MLAFINAASWHGHLGVFVRQNAGITSCAGFQLQQDEPCPYRPNDSVADIGLEILIAYDPDNKLLATYLGQEHPISMWSMRDITGIRILRLNTYGYELEFIDDGEYLRARNVNAWKVYSVADILDYANRR